MVKIVLILFVIEDGTEIMAAINAANVNPNKPFVAIATSSMDMLDQIFRE